MNRRAMILVSVIAALVCFFLLGAVAHAFRIDAHVAAFFRPKAKPVVYQELALATSTVLVSPTPTSTGDIQKDLNDYWLSKINLLRVGKNLLPLSFDNRLAATANVWATQMGTSGVLTHDRPNGETVHQWVEAYHLPFTDRGPTGWNGNYFTENIGRAFADSSTQSMEKGLDQVLGFMVDEGPTGDHYRTIFSPDWNRYGGGFYFAPAEGGRIQIYMAFHYASLK